MKTLNKFWMVYRVTGNSKAKSRVPRFKHPTLESAEVEATRLANFQPGVPFVIMESVGLSFYVAPPQKEEVVEKEAVA